ncbi:uncharacterized protein LOC117644586 isoform X2 [Thrips palmi]|uniref:Uncharacterized protein LOC117644586 isoform X2 n=1 Tax=Thrips palmi TaxID=161013 RepID=A0A6P8YRR2_THRPL|nr:uncharacterized protein LOC117644586 isoform X2 [Thrips palmi]
MYVKRTSGATMTPTVARFSLLSVVLLTALRAGLPTNVRRAVAAGQVTFTEYMSYTECNLWLGCGVPARPEGALPQAGDGGQRGPVRGGPRDLLRARVVWRRQQPHHAGGRVDARPRVDHASACAVLPGDPGAGRHTAGRPGRGRRAHSEPGRLRVLQDEDFRSNNGASSDPCELTYAGPKAASEPETISYQNFVRNLNAGKRVKMYVNLHNPEQSIYIPWGYSSTAPKVPDTAQLTTIAKEANSALVAAGARAFTVETMAADYPATGTVSDWVRGVAGVAQSFCMELPAGGPDKQQGFAVPPSSILPISKEVLGAMKVFVKYTTKPLSQ